MIYVGTFLGMSARYSLSALTIIFLCYIVGLAPSLYAAEPSHEIETISVYASAYILVQRLA